MHVLYRAHVRGVRSRGGRLGRLALLAAPRAAQGGLDRGLGEVFEREVAAAGLVQDVEVLVGDLEEFHQGDVAVDVEVGGGDRLGLAEELVGRGALERGCDGDAAPVLTAALRPLTTTGVVEFVVDPLPSSP